MFCETRQPAFLPRTPRDGACPLNLMLLEDAYPGEFSMSSAVVLKA